MMHFKLLGAAMVLALAGCSGEVNRPSKGFGENGTFKIGAAVCADASAGATYAQVASKYDLVRGLPGFRRDNVGYYNASAFAGNATAVKIDMSKRGECGFGVSALPREDYPRGKALVLKTLQEQGFAVKGETGGVLGSTTRLSRNGTGYTLNSVYSPSRQIDRDTLQVATGIFILKRGG